MGTFLARLRLWTALLGVVVAWSIAFAQETVNWKPYTVYVEPNKTTATLRVEFKTVEQVRSLCSGAVGCIKGTMDEKGNFIGVPLIIAPKPTSFNDQFALIILGHEVLHVLGAYHD